MVYVITTGVTVTLVNHMAKKNDKGNSTISANYIMSKYGISYQTVNHYTDFGLLPVFVKKGNVRLYNKGVVESRMRKIQDLKHEGYSLRLIRKRLIGI